MADTPSYEKRTEIEYEALIKTALGNEKRNYNRDRTRLASTRILFSDMVDWKPETYADESASLAYADAVEMKFQVMHFSVPVRNAILYDALTQIDSASRVVVLMAYWLDMSDLEIADEIGSKRRTVNEIRRRTCRKLRIILEADGYDANRFFYKP